MSLHSSVATRPETSPGSSLLHGVLVVLGAAGLTLAFFLVLPLIQAITDPIKPDMMLREANAVTQPPPPDTIQEEPEPEEEQEEEQPELEQEPQTLDLAQLELAMSDSFGGSWLGGAELAVDLGGIAEGGAAIDSLFSAADLDQTPRVVYSPGPVYDAKVRRKVPGSSIVVFVVNEQGRVEDPNVLESTDPVFDRPALNAIKKWRFEPGKKNGEAVPFRMRIEIVFPEQ